MKSKHEINENASQNTNENLNYLRNEDPMNETKLDMELNILSLK